MTKVLSIKEMPIDCKIILLKELGYRSDGRIVLDAKGTPVLDKYTNKPVEVANMAILPGSTIIVDDNPFSIMSYLDEYGDV